MCRPRGMSSALVQHPGNDAGHDFGVGSVSVFPIVCLFGAGWRISGDELGGKGSSPRSVDNQHLALSVRTLEKFRVLP